jgi:hypothetical protein
MSRLTEKDIALLDSISIPSYQRQGIEELWAQEPEKSLRSPKIMATALRIFDLLIVLLLVLAYLKNMEGLQTLGVFLTLVSLSMGSIVLIVVGLILAASLALQNNGQADEVLFTRSSFKMFLKKRSPFRKFSSWFVDSLWLVVLLLLGHPIIAFLLFCLHVLSEILPIFGRGMTKGRLEEEFSSKEEES